MAEVGGLFPSAECRPITVKNLFPSVNAIRTYGGGVSNQMGVIYTTTTNNRERPCSETNTLVM